MSTQKKFHGSLFGYKKADVNQFLLEFNASYEQMEEYYRDAMRQQANLLIAADEEKKALAGKCGAMESELAAANEKLSEMQEALSRKNAESEELEALRESLKSKEAEMDVLRDSFDDTVSAAKEGIDGAQSIIGEQAERIAALESELSAANAEKEQAKAVIAQTKDALEVTKAEIEQIKAESRKMAETIAATVAPNIEHKAYESDANATARAEQILAEARKQADEIVAKARQTAQLIKISALRREDAPKSSEKEKAVSAAMEPEQIRICLNEMYGDGEQ